MQFDIPLRLSWDLCSDKRENERKCTGFWLEMDRPIERKSSLKGSQCREPRREGSLSHMVRVGNWLVVKAIVCQRYSQRVEELLAETEWPPSVCTVRGDFHREKSWKAADHGLFPAVTSTAKPDFLSETLTFFFLKNHEDKVLVFLLCKGYTTLFHLIWDYSYSVLKHLLGQTLGWLGELRKAAEHLCP